MTLAPDEFIRRFLLHVLPKGFHRIRHDTRVCAVLAGSKSAFPKHFPTRGTGPQQHPFSPIEKPAYWPRGVRPCPDPPGREVHQRAPQGFLAGPPPQGARRALSPLLWLDPPSCGAAPERQAVEECASRQCHSKGRSRAWQVAAIIASGVASASATRGCSTTAPLGLRSRLPPIARPVYCASRPRTRP
jgi:hypothetical protein